MKAGALGELAVAKELALLGHEIYVPMTDSSGYDLLCVINDKPLRVEVKSTSKPNASGSYVLQIKKVRSNKTTNKISDFDNTKVDILALYLEDIDKVILLDAKLVTQKSAIQFKRYNMPHIMDMLLDGG